ncbi:hypothetical protein [Winogradskyella jejuensis]|uniref:Uncharacterized protein n=1 Tax=Winogradskyella jejuensis TaxID=1089305 RepID=A0A1M5UFJ3_9FLAO|nr:hypothetical protein [Winogradskyella jejuensis]SHH61739.1 hypothetical protein SAMN05444148_2466 [Winogradskyella jejuensis]
MLIKLFNVLLVFAAILLAATIIRTLIYLIIGMPIERIFNNNIYAVWGISILIIVVRFFYLKSSKNS